MKRFLFSLILVGVSAFYIILSNQYSIALEPPSGSPPIAENTISGSSTPEMASGSSGPGNPVPSSTTTSSPPSSQSSPTTQKKNTTTTPTPSPTPTPTPAPKPKGQYVDGSYTGSAADAYYGMVQVKAVIQGGKLTDVQFLQYPNTHSTSVFINEQAMPYLTQEAVLAQSANVNIVSGATDTSLAFQQSLASALSQAKS